MKIKSLLTVVLLVFVAASVAAMVLKEAGRGQAAPSSEPPAALAAPASGAKLIAYYFHGKVRCVTCTQIEANAKEAVEQGFGPELKDGRLEWRVVNYDEPGNEHFTTDYKLAAPCVVLVSMRDGRPVSWKSLPEVWELVDDKPALLQLVQKNVRELLARNQATAKPSSEAVGKTAKAAATPRLLDLGADKCIPCKKMAAVLEELREQYQGRLDVVFIDVWKNPDSAAKYGVEMIPTQIFFDAAGKERFRHVGFISKDEILSKWKELGVDLGDGKKS